MLVFECLFYIFAIMFIVLFGCFIHDLLIMADFPKKENK